MNLIAFDEANYKNAEKAPVKKPTQQKAGLMETQILE
jgi:hypothetical protein